MVNGLKNTADVTSHEECEEGKDGEEIIENKLVTVNDRSRGEFGKLDVIIE